MKEVAIIGGGISGLLTAHFLLNRGFQVRVFESKSASGGWIRSECVDGDWIEWGPNTLMAGKLWQDVFDSLSLTPLYSSERARKRYIYLKGQRIRLGPQIILKPSRLKWILKDAMSRKVLLENDLSISDFFGRHLGSEITQSLVDAFVGGVFAGDILRLSARACFPKLWKGVSERGSLVRAALNGRSEKLRMVSFDRGLQRIPDALAHRLGAALHLKHSVEKIEKTSAKWILKTTYGRYEADRVVLSCPAFAVAEMAADLLHPDALMALKAIRYQRMMVWNTAFSRPANFFGGFGILFPRSEKVSMSGSLWSSEIFSGRNASDHLVTSQFYAGDQIPENPERDLAFLAQLLGASENPIWSRWKIYERAIPQFDLGHTERISRIRESLPTGFYLVGNYLDAVGLSGLIETSFDVAERISASQLS